MDTGILTGVKPCFALPRRGSTFFSRNDAEKQNPARLHAIGAQGPRLNLCFSAFVSYIFSD